MAILGQFTFNDSEYYGASTLFSRLRWLVSVDWDEDGLYDEENEAFDRLYEIYIRRGRRAPIGAAGFLPIAPGFIRLKLYDPDGRYNPYNGESELNGLVFPGKKMQVKCIDETTGTEYFLFVGYVSDIQVVSSNGKQMAYILGQDGLGWLSEQSFDAELKTDYHSDDIASEILTGVSWPDSTDLEDTGDNFAYWWAYNTKSALSALEDVYLPLGAKGFTKVDGTYALYSPYRTTAVETTLTEGVEYVADEIVLPMPWDIVRNQAEFRVYGREEKSSATIWQTEEIISLAAGASITLWGHYAYNDIPCPAASVVTPVVTTDYLMNTAADGSGSNISADLGIVTTKYSTSVKLDLTNNNAATGYITLLKVRGNALTAVSVTIFRDDDTDSQDKYGIRKAAIDYDLIQDSGGAEDIADWIIVNYATPHPMPELRMVGEHEKQLELDLFDRVTLAFPTASVTGDFEVGHIEHYWREGTGQLLETAYVLEPILTITDSIWQFPTVLGRSSIFS